MGKTERIYREFRDTDNDLINPTSPHVTIYSPKGVEVDSGTPTGESTGVYYFLIDLSTAATTEEGYYQAYWEGTIGGALVTMDIPQYFLATRIPWQITESDSIINSIRRMTGDINPNNYRISTEDMYYYLKDAVEYVQAYYNWGYEVTVSPTSLTWNKTLYATPFVLFKLKTLILILESSLHDWLYDGMAIQVGDIKVNVTPILKLRMDNIKRLNEDFDKLLYEMKMNDISGVNIDTYATGLIKNTNWKEYFFYE